MVEGRRFILCFVEHPGVRGVLLSVNHADRWVLNVPEEIAPGAIAGGLTDERCVEIFRLAVGRPDLPVEILSVLPWEARAEVAERFQEGCVFLAGDAAHVMPPTGAFGMNTGVQDAHNLAWKLAAVLNGTASARLLESYDRERRPVATLTVENAVRAGRQQFAHATPGKRMTGQDTSASTATAPAEPVDDLAVMLGYWYASGAVIESPDPPLTLDALGAVGLKPDGRPGARLPHRWLSGAGHEVSTIDRCAGQLALLTGPAGGAWSEAMRAVASARGIAVTAVQVREVTDLVGDGALLVRPDGFVGWRSGAGDQPSVDLLGGVLDEMLGRA